MPVAAEPELRLVGVLLSEQPLALANADALALDAHLLDATLEVVGLQERHERHDHRRGAAYRRKQHRHEMPIAELGEYEIEHLYSVRSRS